MRENWYTGKVRKGWKIPKEKQHREKWFFNGRKIIERKKWVSIYINKNG